MPSRPPDAALPRQTPKPALTRTQYSSVKELLTLSRKIKELWVFGPLGREDPDRRAKEAQIDADVAGVSALLEQMQGAGMQDLATKLGGAWEVAKNDAEETTANGR